MTAANSYFNENTREELIEELQYVYQSDNRPWVIGYSGGKDSTTVVELVDKMLLSQQAHTILRSEMLCILCAVWILIEVFGNTRVAMWEKPQRKMNQGSLKYEEVKNIFEESDHRYGELSAEILPLKKEWNCLKRSG